MQEIQKIDKIISIILKTVNIEYFQKVLMNYKPRELVYTSFDGDYMHYILDMHKFCMRKNLIPLNPESALGYYVSTISHGGSKIPVMLDCISLALLCENFFVFNPKNKKMPEGVIAEIIYWNKVHNKNIDIYDFFDGCFAAKEFSHKIISNQNLKEIKLNPENKTQIKNRLLSLIDREKIKYGYTVASFYNFKHIDWVRAFCYSNNICPVSPQSILENSLYRMMYSNNLQYLYDRITLLKKTDRLYFFTNINNIDEEIKKLDYFSKLELLYWYFNKDRKNIKIVNWADIDVPKYKRKDWAITDSERVGR
ncbi:hypothetical protein [Lactobacillus isalae]|uniref:hypothetical protein n=1 Tax=Lactobacillus isalae TaxID=2993455 RepID=UPI0024A82CA3|nr:hypothetical protein [Lactobacillus isalae]